MAKKGEKTSEETRAKMAAAHQKRWANHREVYLQNCNYVHIGAKRTSETRRKMHVSQIRQHAVRKVREQVEAVLKPVG